MNCDDSPAASMSNQSRAAQPLRAGVRAAPRLTVLSPIIREASRLVTVTNAASVAAELRTIREAQGLSQNVVEDAAEMPKMTVTKVENNGYSLALLEHMSAYADILGYTLRFVLVRDNDPTEPGESFMPDDPTPSGEDTVSQVGASLAETSRTLRRAIEDGTVPPKAATELATQLETLLTHLRAHSPNAGELPPPDDAA